jgi:hypothetical protein
MGIRLAGAAPSYRRAAGRGAPWLPQENAMSKRMQEERHEAPRPSEGNTVTAQGENQAPKARTPNERDESADSQSAGNPDARRMGAIAHDDVMEGQQDTSKAQETDATYHRLQQTSEPAPVEKANSRQRR